MKFRIWEIVTFTALIIAAIISSSLSHLWAGMVYITSALIVAALIVFINNRAFYIKYTRNEYDAGLELYFVELYNNHLISKEQLQAMDSRIIEGYYKPFKRLKLINILVIVGIVLFLATLILTIIGVW